MFGNDHKLAVSPYEQVSMTPGFGQLRPSATCFQPEKMPRPESASLCCGQASLAAPAAASLACSGSYSTKSYSLAGGMTHPFAKIVIILVVIFIIYLMASGR